MSWYHYCISSLFCFLFQVSLLEYRKRQREARRSGSKTECSSPVSTVPPVTVDAFPVSLESSSEAPAPTTLCSTAVLKEPQMNEETDAAGERGEKEEGQWYKLAVYLDFIVIHCFPNLNDCFPPLVQDVVHFSRAGSRAQLPQSFAAEQRQRHR